MTRAGPAEWRRVAPFMLLVLVVAALYFGRDLLEPFAIASLFTLLLAPAVSLLQRLRMPRLLAVVITVMLALGVVIALSIVVVTQLNELRGSLTEYRVNIGAKLEALGVAVSGFAKGLEMPITPSAGAPLAVTVVDQPSPFALLGDVVGPLIDPLGTFAIVAVLVLFMLIYLEDLRDRIAFILNVRDVTVTIQAATEVSGRISRYLLLTLLINISFGVPVAIGLALLGVPNAILWGVLATLLRFIPYVGPWLAAAMPIALSFAISPGWGLTIAVITLFFILELVSNNVVEPWVYGSRTGLSPLAVIVAAIFWSWLWGLVGLFLSVPLTLILVVSGRYVRPLRFLYTLFGDGPGLEPRARFYQRLVADDPDEAARIAELFLTRRPLSELYDALMIPALRSLKFDEAAGWMQPAEAAVMRQSLRVLVADLPAVSLRNTRRRLRNTRADQAERDKQVDGFERVDDVAARTVEEADTAARSEADTPSGMARSRSARVTFVPAGDESDALVGAMLAEVMLPEVTVETISPSLLTSELVALARSTDADVILVGGFLPGSLVRARHLVARLSEPEIVSRRSESAGIFIPERAGSPPIVVGLWNASIRIPAEDESPPTKARSTPTLTALLDLPVVPPDPEAVENLESVGAREVVHTLTQAVDAVRRLLRADPFPPQ